MFTFSQSSTAANAQPLPWAWVIVPALVLAGLAVMLIPADTNREVFLRLNGAAQGWAAPSTWSAVTLTGSVLGAIALLAPSLKTQPRWLASAFLAAPLAILFSQGGKRYFEEMRPAGLLPAESFTLIGEKLYVYSFPSGHATTAFVAAAAVILAWPTPGRRGLAAVGVLLLASLVALSRIAVGAHWPVDVATGAAGGWLCGTLGVALSGRLRFWQRESGVRIMATCALISSLALLVLDLGYPAARLYQIGLGAWGIGGAAAALMRDRSIR